MGERVGESVGDNDGASVGDNDGDVVGASDGNSVGKAVGNGVGKLVGSGVGAGVMAAHVYLNVKVPIVSGENPTMPDGKSFRTRTYAVLP